jgi:hypothetical protein
LQRSQCFQIRRMLEKGIVPTIKILAHNLQATEPEAYCVVPGSSTFSVVGTIAA